MARRRRVRIPLGFGSGGRTALISSLLPTASEQAAAQSAIRAADNAKVAAFNRGEISFDELKAYFTERLAQTNDSATKTEIQSLIDNAKAADNKNIDNKATTTANQAIKDFQTGNSSYSDALATINASIAKAVSPEAKDALKRLLDDASTVNLQRNVNQKIDDYNKSRVSYDDLRAFLNDQAAGSKNDLIKQQIASALDGARAAENRKVIAQAQGDLNSGVIDLNAYVQRLTDLRNQSDQRNPDSLQEIGAAIIQGEQQEQAVQDSKTYTAWQEGMISASDALAYYNARLATARDPKTVDALGKYAANLKQAIVENNGMAFGQAASTRAATASRASVAAALKTVTDEAAALVKDFKDNEFKSLMKTATDTGNPETVMLAYDLLGQTLSQAASLGGSNSDILAMQASNSTNYGYLMASNVVFSKFQADQKDIMSKIASSKDPLEKAQLYNDLVDASVKAETGGWLDIAAQIDPKYAGQVDQVVKVRYDVALRAQAEAQAAKDAFEKSKSGASAALDTTLSTLARVVGSGSNKNANEILAEIGIQPSDVATADGKKKILDWVQTGDTAQKLDAILRITNLGEDPTKAVDDLQIAAETTKIIDALSSTNTSRDAFVRLALAAGNAAYPGMTKSLSDLSQQADRGETPNPVDPVLLASNAEGAPPPFIENANARENRVATDQPRPVTDVAPDTSQMPFSPLATASGRIASLGVPKFLTDVMDGFGNWLQAETLDFRTARDAAGNAINDVLNPTSRDALVNDLITRASAPGFQVNVPDQQQPDLSSSVPDWSGIIPPSYTRPVSDVAPWSPPEVTAPPPPPPAWSAPPPPDWNAPTPSAGDSGDFSNTAPTPPDSWLPPEPVFNQKGPY